MKKNLKEVKKSKINLQMKNRLLKIHDSYKNLSPLVKFGINGTLLVLCWFGFYHFFRYNPAIHSFYEDAAIDFTRFLINTSKSLLQSIGYEVETLGKLIKILPSKGVYVDKGCLGRNVMGVFTGFVLAYPSKLKIKLWFIPAGLVIINILNIFRICGLAILAFCCPEQVEFNHHFVFKIIVYAFVVILWYILLFKLNKK